MKPPFQFLVKPVGGVRYSHTKKIGDKDFIVSSSQEDHRSTNRFAEVLEVPYTYKGEIKKGDTLLVHHNVFRKYYDIKGREKSGPSFFMDNLFLIDFDQFFLYKSNINCARCNNTWKAPNPYCFVAPVKNKDTYNFNNSVEHELVGEIRYPNKEMIDMVLKTGDIVSFQPESEYEFNVEGEKIYRMFTKNICILLDNEYKKD